MKIYKAWKYKVGDIVAYGGVAGYIFYRVTHVDIYTNMTKVKGYGLEDYKHAKYTYAVAKDWLEKHSEMAYFQDFYGIIEDIGETDSPSS